MDELARQRFRHQLERDEQAAAARARGETPAARAKAPRRRRRLGGDAAHPDHRALPLLPRARDGHGRLGRPHRGVDHEQGHVAQKERWALPVLTMEKIGAWAITEPGSGSDAFGGMKATARRDGDGYLLNGNKTFITNGPYADTHRLHLQARRARRRAEGPQDPPLRARQGHARARAVEAHAEDGAPQLADGRALPDRRARREGPPPRRERGARGVGREDRREGHVLDGAHGRRGDVRSASSSAASSSRSSTRRPASPGASRSASTSSSSSSSRRWRWRAPTCRTWCSATSRPSAPASR